MNTRYLHGRSGQLTTSYEDMMRDEMINDCEAKKKYCNEFVMNGLGLMDGLTSDGNNDNDWILQNKSPARDGTNI